MRSLVRRKDDRITPQGVRLIRDVRTLLLRDCGRHPPVVVGYFRGFLLSAPLGPPSFALSANFVATL